MTINIGRIGGNSIRWKKPVGILICQQTTNCKFSMLSFPLVDEISSLIKECGARGIRFIYGIAPGLNITFSSEKDGKYLRDKVDQVRLHFVTYCCLLKNDTRMYECSGNVSWMQ